MPQSQTMKVCKAAKAGEGLEKEAMKEEKTFEQKSGHHLEKGAERFDERARAAGGPAPTDAPDAAETEIAPEATDRGT
ncbi:hypothetical protein [Pseudohoeflea coraliihabitans]|uniref:Uncharacterized protein n=1 Tax=Pseudohoeflea coraliihabitans TaxID=2860393 RepID=A0ABS6WRX6_9HYPH|nr:hypothetical protein [Pseudohoeflea sp. DP4N28-3]MBW3098717.1 hypothetical protein [Pseudohoeflea sp. DP4N28-3]